MSFQVWLYILLGVLAKSTCAIPFAETENVVNPFLSSRIVGGSDAPLDYAPHMVGLVSGGIIPFLVCGGSIIGQRHVLTAAHCIDAFLSWEGNLHPNLQGVIGTVEYDSLDNIIKFSRHDIHPEYDRWIIKNDIGVLTTTERIKLSKYVAVIPLNFDWVGGNEECSATGWGLTHAQPQTKYLQKLIVNTLSPKACQQIIEDAFHWINTPPIDHEIEICTYHSIGKGMCNGDSGSALVLYNTIINNKYNNTRTLRKTGGQVGIVSWGFPCAIGLPDFFVRVSAYKVFLHNILKEEHSLSIE